ncbi:MAG: hypothetical protein RSC49_01045 [Clostridium sp.]
MMEDPQKLVDSTQSLAKTAVDLAQAASDYGALKVIFGLFVVIVILMILAMAFSLFLMVRKVNKIERASDKTLQYFDNLSNRTIGKEEGNAVVRETLNKSSTLVKYYILRIRWENHIDDTTAIQQKISMIIENNFAEMNSFLSKFICLNKPLSNVVNYEDRKVLKQLITESVYTTKENFTPSNMDQTVELFFNGLKLDYLKKLEEL